MKIGIVGSRDITDKSVVNQTLSKSPWFNPIPYRPAREWGITLVSGGADGVDTSAEKIASEMTGRLTGEPEGLPIEVIEPDWSDWSNGHPALARNSKIVDKSDAIIAVWDGQSTGTRDTIDKALDNATSTYVEVIE